MATLAACASPSPPPETSDPDTTEAAEGVSAPWDAARLAGAGFRAVGNEPGWIVTVYPDSLSFVTNYGEERYHFDDYAVTGSGPYVYRATTADDTLTVTLSDEDCLDDMSGFPYETTVVIGFDGQTYRGCGRRLD